MYLIKNGNVILPEGIRKLDVLIDGDRIAELSPHIERRGAETVDASGLYVSPGFIDIHTHGAGGYDIMDGGLEPIYRAAQTHLSHGTTSIYPTTMSSSIEDLKVFLTDTRSLDPKKENTPKIMGFHLEGPYLSPLEAGAQSPDCLCTPKKEDYEELFRLSPFIKRWSFAPELEGALPFFEFLQEKGIVASAAHTAATCAEIENYCNKGLRLLTHFYSGMRSVVRKNGYRIAGTVEAGYLLDDLSVEIIADGSHLPAELLRLVYKIKGKDKIILVTDSMRAAGMPDGNYYLGKNKSGILAVKEDGVAKLPDRTAFAGSTATMDLLVRNMIILAGSSLHEAVNMASLNPARIMGIDNQKGRIAPSLDADILIFNENIDIRHIFLRGKPVV